MDGWSWICCRPVYLSRMLLCWLDAVSQSVTHSEWSGVEWIKCSALLLQLRQVPTKSGRQPGLESTQAAHHHHLFLLRLLLRPSISSPSSSLNSLRGCRGLCCCWMSTAQRGRRRRRRRRWRWADYCVTLQRETGLHPARSSRQRQDKGRHTSSSYSTTV